MIDISFASCRRRLTFSLTLLFIVFFMAGCEVSGIARGLSYASAPTPLVDPSQSIIYLYRTDETPGYASTKLVTLNESEIVELGHGGYTWFQVDAGEYQLSVSTPVSTEGFDLSYEPSSLHFSAAAGEVYYLHFTIGVEIEEPERGIHGELGFPAPALLSGVHYEEALRFEENPKALPRLRRYQYQPSIWPH